jgi:hypothetical protein
MINGRPQLVVNNGGRGEAKKPPHNIVRRRRRCRLAGKLLGHPERPKNHSANIFSDIIKVFIARYKNFFLLPSPARVLSHLAIFPVPILRDPTSCAVASLYTSVAALKSLETSQLFYFSSTFSVADTCPAATGR